VALVVLLKGINVGGHRTFRPSTLVEQLQHLDAVNIGAAGTFVIRRPVARTQLRAELASRLPFDAEIVVCQGREIVRLMAHSPFTAFSGRQAPRGIVRFVSVLSRAPRASPPLPMRIPATGRWLLQVLARDGRFVFGVYRRHMKVITYLQSLDRIFAAPATTRNWSTITAIANVLGPDLDRADAPGRRAPTRALKPGSR
jgi:uncharacterized protein (DUF1697 family)